MNLKNLFNKLIHLFLALYIFIWYGCIMPEMLISQVFSYTSAGIAGAIVMCSMAIVFISNIKFAKVLQVSILVLIMGLMAFTVYQASTLGLMILAVLQGLLLGISFKNVFLQQKIKEIIPYWSLGLLLSFATSFFTFDFTFKSSGPSSDTSDFNIITATSSAVDIDYSFLSLISVTFLVLLVLILINKENVHPIAKINDEKQPNTCKYFGYFITSSLIIIEVSFFFWTMLLIDKSQSFIYQLTLPVTLLMVFLLRISASKMIQKFSDVGWLLVLTTLLTLSMGLFYTFDFTLLFIVFFSITIAFTVYISNHIFDQKWDVKKVAMLLSCSTIMSIVAGLYIENHIEFIDSIKMPENVLHLSARQAWVKELASLTGLILITTGIVFLNRSKWLSRL